MNKHERLVAFLLICVSLVVVIVAGAFYTSSVRNDAMAHSIENVKTVTKQQEQAFSNFVAFDQERVHSFAAYFTGYNSFDTQALLDRVQMFGEVGTIYTVINLENGQFYNNKSVQGLQMGEDERAYYATLDDIGVREGHISIYTGMPMFGYYERFRFKDGTPGMFQKSYVSSDVSEEFSLSFYNDQGFAFVVTRDGDIVLRSVGSSEKFEFENIFESIADTKDNRENLERFIRGVENNETGEEIFNADGRNYLYTYVPVSSMEGWYLVSIVPLSAITSEANEIISSARLVFFIIVVVVLLCLVAVFTMWQVHQNLEKKNREIAYHQQQFSVLTSFLARNTDDVYMMLDKSTFRVEQISANVERVLGVSQEAVKLDVRALLRAAYKDIAPIDFDTLKNMKIGSSIGPVETERVYPGSDEHHWFREMIYDVQIQDKEMIVVYISDRTTEQKIQDTLTESLEAVKSANRAKTTFLSSMSHDIRTPMNAIMGLITLIQEDASDSGRVLEYTHRMSAASQHLLELINNVLDMNKIESGGVTLTISELNLAELIDQVNTIIRPQAKAKDQDFKIRVSNLTSEHLLGDSTRINQVLINMLSNAVKYTPAGGKIEFIVQGMPQILNNYSCIRFIVKDNGQGMSQEYQKVMFDPFTREENTFTNKIQGTGLGMAITKNLVELMGGNIEVVSDLGKGTTFTVELELRIQDKEPSNNFWKEHQISRMIVADDDPDCLDHVLNLMEDTGVHVDYTSDGEEAIRIIRKGRERGEPYDLILLDWKMPKLDGIETARLLRKNYPEKIPILFFTAYDWAEIEEEAKEIGVSHFLPKPFFVSTFQEAIRKVQRTRQTEKAAAQKASSILDGKHILVAEDIEVNRLVLGKILSTRGAVCTMAVNGQEVVEKFTASQPDEYDIVFMDVQMPVMNGYEATQAIRTSGHPSARDVLIIAMTANAFADDVKAALESGMNAHISKPIVIDQMENTVRKAYEDRAAAQE